MTTTTQTPRPFAPAVTSNAYVTPSTRQAVDRQQSHMTYTSGKAVSRYAALTRLQTPTANGRLVLSGGDTSNGLRAYAANSNGTLSGVAVINRMLTVGATVGDILRALALVPSVRNPHGRLSAHLSNMAFYSQREQLIAAGCVISADDTIPTYLLADGAPVLDRRHAARLAKRDDVRLFSPLLCALHNVVQPDVVARKAGKVAAPAKAQAAKGKATTTKAAKGKKTANG